MIVKQWLLATNNPTITFELKQELDDKWETTDFVMYDNTAFVRSFRNLSKCEDYIKAVHGLDVIEILQI